MNRLDTCFAALREKGRKALVTYQVAGDPDAATTVELMHAMVEGGADIIELGVPFSDPVADGPVIQAACERALRGGTRLATVFEIVRQFRHADPETPVVLMGYLNPLEALGYEEFCEAAAQAGADALLVVDLPADEAGQLSSIAAAHSLALVCLTAPTTNPDRLAHICRSTTGFVYYVSLRGVTGKGAGQADRDAMAGQLQRIRALTDRPVGVGFGISDAATAAQIASLADAVIIGSALVERIGKDGAAATKKLTGMLAEIRRALDEHEAA